MKKIIIILKNHLSNTQSISSGTLAIMFFTLFSKVLGLIREMVLAANFGTSWQLDALLVGMDPVIQIGNTIASAIAAMMIPVYLEEKSKENPENLKKYTTQILITASFILIGLGAIVTLFPNLLIKMFAPNFNPKSTVYAVEKMRFMGIIPLLQGINSLSISILRAERKYSQSAVIQIFFNIAAIPVLLLFASILGEVSYLLSFIIGTLFMNFLYFFLIHKKISKSYFFRCFKNKKVNETIRLSFPLILSGILSISFGIVDKAFASFLQEGSITTLKYAQMITSMIITIVIGSLLSTIFTELSELSNKKDENGLIQRMRKTTNDLFDFSIPFTGYMIVMAQPVISILFQRGAFNSQATENVSSAFIGYMISFVVLPQNLLISKFFESTKRTKITLYASFINFFGNIVFNSLLIKPFGTTGLALSSSFGAFVHYIFLTLTKKKFFPAKLINFKIFIRTIAITVVSVSISLLIKHFVSYSIWLITCNLIFFALFYITNKRIFRTIYSKFFSR